LRRELDEKIGADVGPAGDGMPDHKEVLDRLDRYAKACARNILREFDLGKSGDREIRGQDCSV